MEITADTELARSGRVGQTLDIIMPVYHEGEPVSRVLDSLIAAVQTPFRLVVCYDMDDDPTLTTIKRYEGRADLNLLYVKNQGRGVLDALRSGIRASNANAVMIYVADDISNAHLVDRMFKEYARGAELVVGSRFIPGGCMRGCPPLKSFLVRSGASTLYYLAGLPIKDPTNGVRIYDRRIFEELEIESSDGWAFNLELLIKCHALGYKIAEVPYQHFERVTGESKFRVFKWLPQYLRWYFLAFLLRLPMAKQRFLKVKS
ncbi:MAG: glycosyltransferase [Candidatus Obscuribacterales bacterium]|nr:glycosyltransferase [Candidatus Obscuribacterales bacterium]